MVAQSKGKRGRPAKSSSNTKTAPDGEIKTKKVKKSVYKAVNKGAIYTVIQGVHPSIKVSNKALEVLQSMLADLLEKVTHEAGSLSKYGGRQSIQAHDIQGATKMLLGGDLVNYAMAEGQKAVDNYLAAKKKEKEEAA